MQWILLKVIESSIETRKISWSVYRQWEDSRTLLYLVSASQAVGASLQGAQGCPCSPKQGLLWPSSDRRVQTAQNLLQSLLGFASHIRTASRLQQHLPVERKAKLGRAGWCREGDGNELPYFNAIFENSLWNLGLWHDTSGIPTSSMPPHPTYQY